MFLASCSCEFGNEGVLLGGRLEIILSIVDITFGKRSFEFLDA